jgi:hypothetical protein
VNPRHRRAPLAPVSAPKLIGLLLQPQVLELLLLLLLFDFPRPGAKTYTETIRTLAGLARFVIVDLSGSSVPQEITATVDLYEIPFVPILEQKRKDWSMFRDFLVKERVLEPIRFTSQDHLLELLADKVIAPAEKLIEERQRRLDKIFGRA